MKYLKGLGALALSIFVCSSSLFAQFTENKGQVFDHEQQAKDEVKFYYTNGLTSAYFLNNKVVFSISKLDDFDASLYENNRNLLDSMWNEVGRTVQRIDLEFVDANSSVEIQGEGKSKHISRYYLNGREGINNVHEFQSITYKNIYSGVDIKFYEDEKGLKYDIILNENADLKDVQLRYNGAQGIELNENTLNIQTHFEPIKEDMPLSYFNNDPSKEAQVSYILKDDIISFDVKKRKGRSLTIDPTLTWVTYFESASGGDDFSYYFNVADNDGNYYFYAFDYSASSDFPIVDPGGTAYFQSYNSSSELYIKKFDQNRALVWATYYGGSGGDRVLGNHPIVVDETNGTLHMVADESSNDIPLVNGGGYFNNSDGPNLYFRMNKTTGELLHSTYMGGYSSNHPSIALSSSGLVAIVSDQYDWSTPPIQFRSGAYNQGTNGGFKDLFLVLLNNSYNQIWGTYLGGPASQESCSVAFDSNDNIFFVYETIWSTSSNATSELLQNPGGSAYYQTANDGEDFGIGKFTSSGSLFWHTLYGGNGNDGSRPEMGNGTMITIVPNTDEVIITGGTTSDNLPLQTLSGAYNITAPVDTDPNGGSYWDFNSFILKFNNSGVRNWATYWGDDNSGDLIYETTFTNCNKFFVAGRADIDEITLAGRYNQGSGGQSYLMQFDANYSAEWSSHIGQSTSIARIAYTSYENRMYMETRTYNASLTTLDPGGGAYYDNSVISTPAMSIWEFNIVPTPSVSDETICSGTSASLTASDGVGSTYEWYTSATGGSPVATGATFNTPNLTNTTTYYVSSSNGSCVSERVPVTVTVTPGPTPPTISNNGPLCPGDNLNLTANTISGATYSWTGPNSFSSSNEDPTVNNVTSAEGGTYSCTVEVAGCTSTAATTSVTINTVSTAPTSISGTTNICEGSSTTLTLSGGSAGTGASAEWYSGSCGSSVIGTNNSISVSPTSSTSYFVAYSGTCNTTSCATVTVNVTPAPGSPTWTSPGSICESSGTVDLDATVTGASGGTWSGTGVSGSTFDPTGLSGSINITYTTGTSPCTDDLTQSITVTPEADPTWTSPGTICESSGSVDLDATITGDAGGSWSGTGVSGSTFDPTGLAGQSIDVTYTVGSTPCQETLTQTIVVETTVTAAWTAPTGVCESDDPIDLTPFVTGSTGGSWSGSGISGSNFDPSGQSGTVTITYSVGSGSCTDSQDQTITVNAAPSDPTVSVDNDTICEGETVEITATGSGTGATYNVYSDAAGTNLLGTTPLSVTPNNNTDYYVEAVNSNNCANAGGPQLISVTVNPAPAVNAGADITICGSEEVTLNATGDGTLAWNTGDIGGQLVVSPTITTTYTVTATNANNCSASDDVTITVASSSGTINAVDDLFNVTTNEISDLDVLDNDTYPGLSPVIIQNPSNGIASVQNDGTISYTSVAEYSGTDSLIYEICDPQCASNCDTAVVIIRVSEIDGVDIPDGFSPNGDNINEVFVIEGLSEYPNNSLTIFNRWGDVVFEAAPYQNNWDGTTVAKGVLFGEKVPPGTYFYILDLGDGTNAYRGSLELKY